jgi:hypothetical protein
METNKRALIILQMLVLSSVVIFFVEKKFLVNESRGATLSHYQSNSNVDKVILLVEDFEGLSKPGTDVKTDSVLKSASFFSYGGIDIAVDHSKVDKNSLASATALKVTWNGKESYGGWGKGVGANLELNTNSDYLSFRVFVPAGNGDEILKLILQEDDNENGILEPELDDSWFVKVTVPAKNQWQMVSVPLKSFSDENEGGDHALNVTKKGGIHNLIFSFEQPYKYTKEHQWYFDFICFTNEKMTDSIVLQN